MKHDYEDGGLRVRERAVVFMPTREEVLVGGPMSSCPREEWTEGGGGGRLVAAETHHRRIEMTRRPVKVWGFVNRRCYVHRVLRGKGERDAVEERR